MNPNDLTQGKKVRVSTSRRVAGSSWLDKVGTVFGEWRRGDVEDWCLVEIPDDGVVLIGFAPDELDPA